MNLDTILTLGVIFFMLYSSILFLVIFSDRKNLIKKDPVPKKFPKVTIVVPVYKGDQKKFIAMAVKSCLELDYPDKEVIISWNGKKNENYDFCRTLESKSVKLISTEKPGKAAGMNNALKHIDSEFFCCLDGDSMFNSKALNAMIGYFEDSSVSAVTSAMRVYNPQTLIQKVQWMEYLFAIYLRKLMSFLNGIYVVPGPGSVYRTKIVRDIGGFDENNLTEDMEIAFRMQKLGYKIQNSANAFVETSAPMHLWELIKQRVRWYVGFVDNVVKYRFLVLNPKHGSLGMYILPMSMLWVVVLFYTFGKMFTNIAKGLDYNIRTFLLTGFHLDLLWQRFIDSLYFQPNFMTLFIVVFMVIGVTVMILSLWASSEKIDVRKKYVHYSVYFCAYSFLVFLFWAAAIIYIVTRGITKKRIQW